MTTTLYKILEDRYEELMAYAYTVARRKSIARDALHSAIVETFRQYDCTWGDRTMGYICKQIKWAIYGKRYKSRGKMGQALDSAESYQELEEVRSDMLQISTIPPAIGARLPAIRERMMLLLEPEEQELLHSFMCGETLKEIASRLGLTPEGVRKRKLKIFSKLRENKDFILTSQGEISIIKEKGIWWSK